MERDKGLPCLSLIFTEPAHGGGSHPDLGAGKGPGNSLEISVPDWLQYRGAGKRAWKVSPFFWGRNLACLGPKQLLILETEKLSANLCPASNPYTGSISSLQCGEGR